MQLRLAPNMDRTNGARVAHLDLAHGREPFGKPVLVADPEPDPRHKLPHDIKLPDLDNVMRHALPRALAARLSGMRRHETNLLHLRRPFLVVVAPPPGFAEAELPSH